MTHQFRGGVVGEQEHGLKEMLFEVGSTGVRAQDAALIAIGRKQQDFGVTAIDDAGKDGGDGRAEYRFGEREITVGEEELDVAAHQMEVTNAIGLLSVQLDGADGSGRLAADPRRE